MTRPARTSLRLNLNYPALHSTDSLSFSFSAIILCSFIGNSNVRVLIWLRAKRPSKFKSDVYKINEGGGWKTTVYLISTVRKGGTMWLHILCFTRETPLMHVRSCVTFNFVRIVLPCCFFFYSFSLFLSTLKYLQLMHQYKKMHITVGCVTERSNYRVWHISTKLTI